MKRDVWSFGTRFGMVAAILLATACGETSTGLGESDEEVQIQLDAARKKIRPLSKGSPSFPGAPTLQPQGATGDANAIPTNKLVPMDGISEDSYGAAVAISGDTLVVGAPDRDETGVNSGAVYIYADVNGTWTLQQKITDKDGTDADNFGVSLAILDDRLLIGSRLAQDSNGVRTGAVHVYERVNNNWDLVTKIMPDNGGEEDYFGYSVALEADVALIGSPQADSTAIDAGAAFIYRLTNGQWVKETTFVPPVTAKAYDFFAGSVALLGTTALIGSWNDNPVPMMYDGAVYAYVHNDIVLGPGWQLQQKLVASDKAIGDTFGYSVGMYGQTAFIGAPYRNGDCSHTGAVYVFTRHSGEWCERQILVPEDKNANQLFGYSVGIYGSAGVIGSYYDDDNGDYSGSAYIYGRSNDVWAESFKFVPTDGNGQQLLGSSVAIEGDTIAVGGIGDTSTGVNAGAVYVFSALENVKAAPALLDSGAQCSINAVPSTNHNAWFIGLGLAAWGVRRFSKKTRISS